MRKITASRAAMLIALGGVCLLALSACTASPGGTGTPSTSASPAATPGSGIRPGYQDQTALEFSPLIIDALSSQVVPVEGSDGLIYVAYELRVLNSAPRDATITAIETLAGDEGGAVLATVDQARIASNTMLIGGAERNTATIPAGRTAIVVFRDTYPARADVPKTFTHRIHATFAAPKEGAPRLAANYPDQVAQIGGALTTSTDAPLVIGSPVSGTNWFANNGLDPTRLNAHSDVVIPLGGRIVSAETYGIDFMRIDPATMSSDRGDPTQNASYLAFDEPLLAVADGKVVRADTDHPDVAPQVLPDLSVLEDATGNQVVLDLGGGVFATYAHMKQGSATVKVGDTVTKGQEIGRLGNSGNTSEAHLHFQLQRGSLISADNVPWVFDTFESIGALSADQTHIVAPPKPGTRTKEIPVFGSVFSIPAK
ncbi:M23 family metallopeptidase [Microbacterium panaciterrae]